MKPNGYNSRPRLSRKNIRSHECLDAKIDTFTFIFYIHVYVELVGKGCVKIAYQNENAGYNLIDEYM